MHVTLINPPTISTPTTYAQEAVPPLGLAYVCAAALAAGHEVHVVDGVGEALQVFRIWSPRGDALLRGLDFDEIVDRVPTDTAVIGVSCMFSNAWPPIRKLLLHLRAARPDACIVLGGEHATACPEYILETCPAVDYCVLGEGERTFVQLLDVLDAGGDPCTLFGVAGRGGSAATSPLRLASPAKRRPRIADLRSIAEPAWDHFPIERYVAGGFNHGVQRGRTMPILASRGCPYQCTFCSSPNMWTTRWSARNPRDVIAEMKGYVDRYGANDFAFYDLTAIVRRDWIVEFCRLLIAEQLDVTLQLPSGTRSEAIDREVAGLLFRAGCRNVNYAPESGAASVLARIKKRVRLPVLFESIRGAIASGIEVKVNVILGFPDETRQEVLQTYEFIARLARAGVDAVSVFPFCPYPGTVLFHELVRRGRLRLSESYFDDLVYTDLGRVVSYNSGVGDAELRMQVLGALAIFHGVQLCTHPRRLLRPVVDVLEHRQGSKIANAIEPLRARRRAYSRLADSRARRDDSVARSTPEPRSE